MRILLIEDDERLCEAVAFALRREGYDVDVAHEGDDGLRWALQRAHDLVLLDRMLPVLDGLTVLRRMREAGVATPVLLVTALGAVGERVEGLDAGADDYLVKPFDLEELLARVRAMCRRPRRLEEPGEFAWGDVALDQGRKTLRRGEGRCSLSKREAALLEAFLKNPRQVLTREVLLTRVWGPDAGVEDGNLDNYIHFLRRRLASVGSRLEIRTVRGVGYRLEDGDV